MYLHLSCLATIGSPQHQIMSCRRLQYCIRSQQQFGSYARIHTSVKAWWPSRLVTYTNRCCSRKENYAIIKSTYQDRPMYLIRAVTVHSNRPKEVWFGPSAYTARILWSGGEIFLLRALGDHLWGHSGALWAPRRAACAERRRRQLPKPLPVSATVCWRSGSLGQGQ